jgi:hypothetical protein
MSGSSDWNSLFGASRIAEWIRGSKISANLETSRVGSKVVAGRARISRFARSVSAGSKISSLGPALGRVLRSSRMFVWLTSEPEPDMIVIDLRETLTVSPIILAIDRMVSPVATQWQRSKLRVAGDALARALSESALFAGLSRFLEPPSLPENRDAESSQGSLPASADKDSDK